MIRNQTVDGNPPGSEKTTFSFLLVLLLFAASTALCAPDMTDVKWFAQVFLGRDLKSDETGKLQSGWDQKDSSDIKVFEVMVSCMKKEKEDAENAGTWNKKKEGLKMKCFGNGFRKLPDALQDGRNLPPFLKAFVSVLEKGKSGTSSAKKK